MNKAMSQLGDFPRHALGFYHGDECFAVDVSFSFEEPDHAWVPLKLAFEYLDLQWFSVAAKAYQILRWDENHRYCGKCGQETRVLPTPFERRCDACALSFFPRISPSIIVMIRRENKILLARSPHFPPGVHALIAGFVEPGETLEAAVHRETKEEVGIDIKNLHYFGSQSWPFPDSLMIAFIADYAAGEIVLADGEIEHADWYDVDHMPGLPLSTVSISRQLIDHFINMCRIGHITTNTGF